MWIVIASGQGRGEAAEAGTEPVTIGSGEGCGLRVLGGGVAPLHASVRREDGDRVVVTALAEDAPVIVDGIVVEGRMALRDGAAIRLGDAELTASARPPDRTEAAAVHRQLDDAFEEVEGPDDAPPVARVRRGVRIATGLAGLALAVAGIAALLAATGVVGGDAGADTASVVKQARPGTVLVEVSGPTGAGAGSGWVLDARRGLVVTNFHVINGGKSFRVEGVGGGRPADVVAAAPCDDVALLKVDDPRGLRALALGAQGDVDPGDDVVALGFPANAGGNRDLTSTAGVVSVVRAALSSPTPETPSLPNMLQTDAALNPGNSGGPLLDTASRLVGMNSAVLSARGGVPIQGQGYAIGVDRLREVLAALRRGRSPGWPGFSLQVPPRRFLARKHLPDGLIAGAAVPGSAAAKAGFDRAEVLLYAVDGHRLRRDMPSYCDAVRGLRGPVDLQVVDRPGGRPKRVTVAF